MIEEMLEENARRMARFNGDFDPVSGRGSVGERFQFKVTGMEALHLPVAMRDEPLVADLIKAGSLTKYLNRRRKTAGLTREDILDEFNRIRMRHDFPFWAATTVYIKYKGGGDDRLFILNYPQRKLVETLESMRLADQPIRLILLKARQWGGSTCVQLYMAWIQLVHRRGLNSLIIAHQSVASEEIKDMFDRMIDRYPDAYLYPRGEMPEKPAKKMEGVGKSRSNFRIPARNSKVKVGTAERPDSCRGGDYALVHLSEVGIWKRTLGNTPEMLVSAATGGILPVPLTMIVYESTANGTGNFFHREYEAAKRGESLYRPLFVAWFEIAQYRLQLTDAERRALALRLAEGRESDTAPNDRSQSGAYLWWLWQIGAPLEGIAWYISERSKYGDHGIMASEYPSDDIEAFVHSGARVFDKYKVENLRRGCCPPEYVGEIDAPGVHSPENRFASDDEKGRWLRQVTFSPIANGGWQIWRLPDGDSSGMRNRYLAVVDVGGRSRTSDWSVIAIFDRMPLSRGEGIELVAQWRGHTDFDILAWKAAAAASFYGEALLVIESNTLETHDPDRSVDGDQSLFLLNRLRRVYPNLYARPQSEDQVLAGAPVRYGFHTNVATKPMIISTLVKVVREALYIERDERCLDEYLTYEQRQNGSYGAILGAHDDLLITRAIALHIAYHEMDMEEALYPTRYRSATAMFPSSRY